MAGMQQQCNTAYKFGPFLLDPPAHLLLKDGKPIALPPKAFDTLLMLVQSQGDLLTKNDLLNTVWPDAYVEENNLTQYVSMLRKVLGDDGNGNKYIETVPRLGYRFVAGVREVAEEEESVLNGSETTRLENRIETATPLPIQSPSARLTRPRLAGASLALIVLGLATIYWVSKPANPVPANVRTLAVLPLRNLKPDPETDFLSMALADAIINRLGYVSQLVVPPASSVSRYRNVDTDARQIARELNVQTVLAGSYVKEGDEMRVTTELISVDGSGSPARDSIELKYDKLLTVQDRVAASVIHSMGLALQPQEVDRLKRGLPTNPEAYEYYLRGRERSLQSDFQGAEKLMESSVSLEPGNARAWADLANNSLGYARVQGGGQFYADKGWEAFQRAVALDPDNPLIVDLMAFQMIENNKVDEAVSVLRKSLQHNANDSWAHWHLSEAYRYGGALNESVKEGELARALNPVVGENLLLNTYLYVGQYEKFLESLPASEDNARTSFYRGLAYCYLKKMSRAVAEFDHAFALDPSLLHSEIGQAFAFALTGRRAQGIEIMRKIEGINTQDGEMIYKMAQAYAQLGDSKSSLRLLRRSIELNFYPYPYFRQDLLLEPLHKEAEYSGLIELARQRHEAFLQRFF